MKEEQKKTILIVEDEESYRRPLMNKFTLEGFAVLGAENGEEGLKLALEHHPDIILLDIMMPKMDGKAMFLELMKDKWGMTVPVIMLTNLADSKTVVENIKDGVSDYLVKSEYKLEDVVEKVKERLLTA